jgi:hypothetical protein
LKLKKSSIKLYEHINADLTTVAAESIGKAAFLGQKSHQLPSGYNVIFPFSFILLLAATFTSMRFM